MKAQLEKVKAEALEAIAKAESAQDLENVRVSYLGKKSPLTAVLKNMGSLDQLLGMMPGVKPGALKDAQIDEKALGRTEAIILSMTKKERENPDIIKQYSADQIAHLIALVLLKQVTPLERVNELFHLMNKAGNYTHSVAYDYFCEELENILYYRFGLKDSVDDVGVTTSQEKEMLRSAVIAVSHIVYLNRCFQILSEQEE